MILTSLANIAMNWSVKMFSPFNLVAEPKGEEERRAVIITGVAGTGKSTLLSHFYHEIQETSPTTWVIRVNLTDHQKALNEFEIDYSGPNSIIYNFLVNLPSVLANNSPFARSLLKHRLETGDRIVLMLDGFDEIDTNCQEKTIQLVKSIGTDTTRSIGLFMTTRPHWHMA